MEELTVKRQNAIVREEEVEVFQRLALCIQVRNRKLTNG